MSQRREIDDERFFRTLLDRVTQRVTNATGDVPEDLLYDRAESVRYGGTRERVYVTYQGTEYGPVLETWSPLDGDHNKSTTLIYTTADKWVLLWYFDSEVQK